MNKVENHCLAISENKPGVGLKKQHVASPSLSFHLCAGRSKDSREEWAGPGEGRRPVTLKKQIKISLNPLN